MSISPCLILGWSYVQGINQAAGEQTFEFCQKHKERNLKKEKNREQKRKEKERKKIIDISHSGAHQTPLE